MTTEDAIHLTAAQARECFLCGSPKLVRIGCYQPSEACEAAYRPIGWPSDQPVSFWYALCRRCLKNNRQAQGALVEEKIQTLVQAGRN